MQPARLCPPAMRIAAGCRSVLAGAASTTASLPLLCRIIEDLLQQAAELGCYKVILDCAEHNVGFYAKSGFVRKEVQMVSKPGSLIVSGAWFHIVWRHGHVSCKNAPWTAAHQEDSCPLSS